MTRLYHYTCRHGWRALRQGGQLIPGNELLANRPAGGELALVSLEISRFVWLTDLAVPLPDALGLTRHHLKCDRTAYRYRVTQLNAAMRWVHVRRTIPATVRDMLEAAPGARPMHWWVAHDPVPVQYDPPRVPRREPSGSGVCEECGNDDAAEGYRFCLDCLAALDPDPTSPLEPPVAPPLAPPLAPPVAPPVAPVAPPDIPRG